LVRVNSDNSVLMYNDLFSVGLSTVGAAEEEEEEEMSERAARRPRFVAAAKIGRARVVMAAVGDVT